MLFNDRVLVVVYNTKKTENHGIRRRSFHSLRATGGRIPPCAPPAAGIRVWLRDGGKVVHSGAQCGAASGGRRRSGLARRPTIDQGHRFWVNGSVYGVAAGHSRRFSSVKVESVLLLSVTIYAARVRRNMSRFEAVIEYRVTVLRPLLAKVRIVR